MPALRVASRIGLVPAALVARAAALASRGERVRATGTALLPAADGIGPAPAAPLDGLHLRRMHRADAPAVD